MADLALVTADKLSVEQSVIQETQAAGEALTAGDLVTFDPATGKFVKADADASDADAPLMVALKSVSAGIGVTAIKKGVVDGFDLSALAYGQAVYLSKTAGKLATAVAGVNEVQTVTITGTPTGGTFTLSFRGEETAALAHNADGAAVQAALVALASIGAGGVTVSGSAGGPSTVTFTGALAGGNVPLLVLSDNSLTGGTDPDATIEAATGGVTQRKVGYVIPAAYTVLGSAYDKLLFVDC